MGQLLGAAPFDGKHRMVLVDQVAAALPVALGQVPDAQRRSRLSRASVHARRICVLER